MKDLFTAIELLVHGRQMGVPALHAERLFREGSDRFAVGDLAGAEKLWGQMSRTLNWEITNSRRLYRTIIRAAGSSTPTDIGGGAVQIWPIMTSDNGDMEWNAAIRVVLIGPNKTWCPPQQNLEKLIYVQGGRGRVIMEGREARVFVGDTICVPPNVVNSFETTGFNFPMQLLVWETYPDRKHDELKGAEKHAPFPETAPKAKISEDTARSVFESAVSTVRAARSKGIHEFYEAALCYDMAESCLRGGPVEYLFALSKVVDEQVSRYISDLDAGRARIDASGVPLSNRMYLEKQFFHAGTCPAWLLTTDLPVEYTQFMSVFEIDPGNRLGPHMHNLEEFYYVLQGRGVMLVADPIGNRYFDKNQPGVEVNPGDLIRVPPDSLHSIFPSGEGYRICCIALGGYTDEKPESIDIEWAKAYEPEQGG